MKKKMTLMMDFVAVVALVMMVARKQEVEVVADFDSTRLGLAILSCRVQ